MIIDTHSHHVPEPMLDALVRRPGRFPSIELLGEDGRYRLSFAAGPPTRPVMPGLRAVEPRLAWMEGQAIDRQVCAGWLDSFGYGIPADEGLAWSRFVNEHLMRFAGGDSRFAALATVPLQDGEAAARALEEAVAEGFAGAMIGTQPGGGAGALDDPALDPFWQRASELGATLYIHPMFGSDDARLHDFGMMNTVGRVNDETVAVARMLFAGHFVRFPGMKAVLSLGGAALPYILGRLVKNWEDDDSLAYDPREGLKALYFDSIVYTPRALGFLVDLVGADRVVLGSDYPFSIGDLEPARVVEESGLDEAARRAILGATAARLFGIRGEAGA